MQLKDLKLATYRGREIGYILLSAKKGYFEAVYGSLEVRVESEVKSLEEPIEVLDGRKAVLNGEEYTVKVVDNQVEIGPVKLYEDVVKKSLNRY